MLLKEFEKNAALTIRELELSDWPAYKSYFQNSKKHLHFSGYFSERDMEAEDTGKNFFKDIQMNGGYRFRLFGLFHNDKIIGQTSIRFTDQFNDKQGEQYAILGGSEITDEYRGQQLVDTFYEFRMAFLKEIQFEGNVRMTIAPDNSPSQKAAARNGFVKTGEMKQGEDKYDILEPDPYTNPPVSP